MTEEQLRKKWPMDQIPDEIRELAVAWASPCGLDLRDTVKLGRDILELFEKMRGKPLLKPSEFQAQFLQWLDKEIEDVKNWKSMGSDPFFDSEKDISIRTLEKVRLKFLTLTLPPISS